ncbi:hypothetical protein DERP_015134 [Dermatophagoides pteronyssinus]|uniref:Uncharacterized protein n=1 Tax=Dermatophagoides pteronyssinus TaxID=6956 RepID=A0ABQ8IZ99_DERPT|nr:hypothetical protein DERP_015134 [Dermatophagoides pteronyssinus]
MNPTCETNHHHSGGGGHQNHFPHSNNSITVFIKQEQEELKKKKISKLTNQMICYLSASISWNIFKKYLNFLVIISFTDLRLIDQSIKIDKD